MLSILDPRVTWLIFLLSDNHHWVMESVHHFVLLNLKKMADARGESAGVSVARNAGSSKSCGRMALWDSAKISNGRGVDDACAGETCCSDAALYDLAMPSAWPICRRTITWAHPPFCGHSGSLVPVPVDQTRTDTDLAVHEATSTFHFIVIQ